MKHRFALLALIPLTSLLAEPSRDGVVAGLQQDTASLRDDVRRLQAEVESLRETLDKERSASRAAGAKTTELAAVHTKIAELDAAQSAARRADKAELAARLDALDGRLESLKTATNKALAEQTRQVNAALAPGAAKVEPPPVKPVAKPEPPPAAPRELPADMPKSGVRYTVKSGDSVPKIAKRMNSKSEWILAANKLRSNADLKAHDVIFIPQPEDTPAPAAN